MRKGRYVQTWLGLLIFAMVVGSWLGVPRRVLDIFGFFFTGSIILLVILALHAGLQSRVALLRGVRFLNEDVQRRLPRRLRWLGRNRFFGAKRHRAKQRRKGAWRAWVRYRGCQVLAVAVFVAGAAIAIHGIESDYGKWISLGLIAGAPLAGMSAMLKLITISRKLKGDRSRYIAAPAHEALAQDSRPPVLWLRSFRLDERVVENIIEREFPLTFEQVTAGPLGRYGPVVAIGRPGEPLPPIGALRDYVGDDWRSWIREHLDVASIIVIVLDETPGVLWELRTVVESGLFERLILVLPPDAASSGIERWKDLAGVVGETLPPKTFEELAQSTRKLLAVVFDADLAQPIVGGADWAEYYQDALELGAWFVTEGRSGAATRHRSGS